MLSIRPLHEVEIEEIIKKNSITPRYWTEWEVVPEKPEIQYLNVCCNRQPNLVAVILKNKLSKHRLQIPIKCLLKCNPSFKPYIDREISRRRVTSYRLAPPPSW